MSLFGSTAQNSFSTSTSLLLLVWGINGLNVRSAERSSERSLNCKCWALLKVRPVSFRFSLLPSEKERALLFNRWILGPAWPIQDTTLKLNIATIETEGSRSDHTPVTTIGSWRFKDYFGKGRCKLSSITYLAVWTGNTPGVSSTAWLRSGSKSPWEVALLWKMVLLQGNACSQAWLIERRS